MTKPAVKKYEIPNDLVEALKVVEAVIAEAGRGGFDDSACFGIRLALDEAVANAIRHGNEGDPDKYVVVEYTLTDAEMRISITDEGEGFSPDLIPDPTLPENLERPCGRGVMLMRAYMNDVSFNERGNCVTMVKSLNCDTVIKEQRA